MKIPNCVKIIWWAILVGGVGFILYKRLSAIMSGSYVPADTFLFLIFVALLLVPIFAEIDFFGIIKLRRDVEDLKNEIHIKLGDIKNEIKSTISPSFTNHIYTHEKLATEDELKKLDRAISTKNITKQDSDYQILDAPKELTYLFQVRYGIETE